MATSSRWRRWPTPWRPARAEGHGWMDGDRFVAGAIKFEIDE
jgi:hypothetical protein